MKLATRLLAYPLAFAAALAMVAQPLAAQEGIGILRDAETEALLQDMVDPLVEAAGLQRGDVEVVLTSDTSINAFVSNGQRIYVNAGLINEADTANEVQGVLAHELGHIVGGHSIRSYEAIGKANKIALLTTLLGIAAAVAGAGDAAMAGMALGQQAALASFLSFSRAQEASADAASVHFLKCAGISGRGEVSFFRKLQNLEFRYGYSQSDDAGFMRTHPLTGDRISHLEADLRGDPAWGYAPDADLPDADLVARIDAPPSFDPDATPSVVFGNCTTTPPAQAQAQAQASDLERRFQLAKAKLYGYLAEPSATLRAYPTTMITAPARYARAYAYHKDARIDQALAECDALVVSDPRNPYFLELKGQILLESGKPVEALVPLRQAVQLTGNEPLIAGTFGHALLATEDKANLDEAENVLRAAVGRDRENPFAWYQLGMVYGERGDIPRARLASAEQQIMTGRAREALQNAEAAERSLPSGSTDWIRAGDVALQARAELEREQERH